MTIYIIYNLFKYMALKNTIIDFLGALEGYHETCKMLHWSTTNHSEHLLLDKIDEDILKFEDRLAEAAMGRFNTRYGIGTLKAMLPHAENTEKMINELEDDILKLKKEIGDEPKYAGLHNILDDMMENVNTYNYLRTLK